MKRREFICDTLLAAAATSAASILPSRLFAQAPQPKKNPNDLINVMVVGLGGRGLNSHVSQFLISPRTRIAWICDADRAYLEKVADLIEEKQGDRPKTCLDMREGFASSEVDVVSCATTNHWHALCGVWAMQAGKHVYIEKPICHNVHEGKTLVAASKKYHRSCQVGSQCRSNPAVKDAIDLIRSGGIGEVKLVRGLCYKRRKAIGPLGQYEVPSTVDYNFWSGPAQIVPVTRPKFHYDWHWQRLYGNGDSGNQGPHQFDIARVFLGETVFPESVITYGGRLGYDVEMKNRSYVDAGDTANTEVSIFNYSDGGTLVFETRGLETDNYMGAGIGVIAYGSEGYVVQSTYGLCVQFDLDGNEVRRFEGEDDAYHFNNFLDCAENDTPEKLNADAREGALSASLAHIGNIDYYLGEKNLVSVEEAQKVLADYPGNDKNVDTLNRTVEHLRQNGVDLKRTPLSLGPALKIDPATEHFVDAPEALAMETRDYRGEFVVPDSAEV